jgi:polar amino acid transport system substrate-binding protein
VAVLDDFRTLEMVHAGQRRVTRQTQDKGWRDEWVAFTKAIRTGGEAPIPYEQLMGVTKAMFAVMESLRTGKTILI